MYSSPSPSDSAVRFVAPAPGLTPSRPSIVRTAPGATSRPLSRAPTVNVTCSIHSGFGGPGPGALDLLGKLQRRVDAGVLGLDLPAEAVESVQRDRPPVVRVVALGPQQRGPLAWPVDRPVGVVPAEVHRRLVARPAPLGPVHPRVVAVEHDGRAEADGARGSEEPRRRRPRSGAASPAARARRRSAPAATAPTAAAAAAGSRSPPRRRGRQAGPARGRRAGGGPARRRGPRPGPGTSGSASRIVSRAQGLWPE